MKLDKDQVLKHQSESHKQKRVYVALQAERALAEERHKEESSSGPRNEATDNVCWLKQRFHRGTYYKKARKIG